MLCAQATDGILAGDDPASNMRNTQRHSAMMKQTEEWQLHRMAKVHDFW